MEKTKITIEELDKLGFIVQQSRIQDSYRLILNDVRSTCPFTHDPYYYYREISLMLCNDKGKGEYYLFLREGETSNRDQDNVTTITRNMMYVEDLTSFINICKL